jgi:pyruvate/oxaloacetate carboxyltransferase
MISANRIAVFDTTLRDGEQSPGCSMNLDEKVRLAHQLEALGYLNMAIQPSLGTDYASAIKVLA